MNRIVRQHYPVSNLPEDLRPTDDPNVTYDPAKPLSTNWQTVHCASLANDGLVYVCDRVNDRIQVFKKDGTYIKEAQIAKRTLGDGVVFDGDRARGEEVGGRVFAVYRNGRSVEGPLATGVVELAFGRDRIDARRLKLGQKVFKTDDPQLTQRLRRTFTGPDATRRVSLDLSVAAPTVIGVYTGAGVMSYRARTAWEMSLIRSRGRSTPIRLSIARMCVASGQSRKTCPNHREKSCRLR